MSRKTRSSNGLTGGRAKRTAARSLPALVLVLVLGVAACGSSASERSDERLKTHQLKAGFLSSTSLPFAPKSQLPKLQFEGDSITHLSARRIYNRYRDDYNVAIQARIGTSTFEEVPGNTGAQAKLRPRVAVVNLGTNDAVRAEQSSANPTDPPQTIDRALANFDVIAGQFPPVTCLVFVTVNTHNPSWAPANARIINRKLRGLAADRPRTFVADWNAAWKPRYFHKPDSPHPNQEGRAALLSIEDQAIRKCPSG
jgi:hypothetical protein